MLDDQKVGRGNPPKQHQFKKGKSGNPKGRPRKQRGDLALLDKVLSTSVKIVENGLQRTMTKEELLITTIVNSAIKGDARAQSLLIKRLKELSEFRKYQSPEQRSFIIRILKSLDGKEGDALPNQMDQ